MFGKKKKELEFLLSQRESENALMKKRISELEAEVKRLKDQEGMVLRAITEADKTADRIEREADEKKARMLAEAEQKISKAAIRANNILASADEEAESIRKEADEYLESQKNEADTYSENIRTDANIYVERTIIASQMEVNKRKDVVNDLNELLKKTTDYLAEQTAAFSDLIKGVIEENESETKELCREIEKCSCNCEECENPCKPNVAPKPGAKIADEDEDEEESDEGAEDEAAEEPETVIEPAEEPAEEQTAASLDEETAPADPAKDDDIDVSRLPEDYTDPAQLMHNIYYLERRDLPARDEYTEHGDRTPAGGITFPDELGGEVKEDLPHDEKLDEIVTEVVEAS